MTQFDRYAQNYNQLVDSALTATGENRDYFLFRRVEWIAKCLPKLGMKPRVLLDYGCGNGASAPYLLNMLHLQSLIGVDVSEQSISEARHNAPPKTTFATLSSFVANEQADLCYCCGVFHHIIAEERASALDYVFRSLKSGGIFFFFEHNPWNPGTRHIMAKCEFDADAIPIAPHRAPQLLRAAGFEILFREFLFVFPKWLRILRPLESALKRMPLGGQYVIVARKPYDSAGH